jgi:hypothetical protein
MPMDQGHSDHRDDTPWAVLYMGWVILQGTGGSALGLGHGGHCIAQAGTIRICHPLDGEPTEHGGSDPLT